MMSRPWEVIDQLLDRITSYRLVLYYLYALTGWAVISAAFGQLPFKWYEIGTTAVWLIIICRLTSEILGRTLKISRNYESDFITALILSLILTPAAGAADLAILAAAGGLAVASKYLVVIWRRHIFNPAATGAFLAGALFHHYASWWVGTKFLTPVVLIGGLLILRKMKRFSLVSLFIVVYLIILVFNVAHHQSPNLISHNIWLAVSATPLLFFATVMLTEPLTSPYKTSSLVAYAWLVGVLYGVTQLHFSPEKALLAGNLLAFLIEPTRRYKLKFIKKQKEADGIYSFIFHKPNDFKFKPGQYLEWTLPAAKPDRRGNRRYFTLSSAPTENNLRLTMRLPQPASHFKQQLSEFQAGDALLASHLAGSFTLPKDDGQKVAWLAGGIGVTPFRSFIKNLLDSQNQIDAVLIHSANQPNELAFKQLFEAAKPAGLKTVYTVTDPAAKGWRGHRGLIDKKLIQQAVPDYKERLFYISGPYSFVQASRRALSTLGVAGNHVITDYFPGYG